MTRHMNWSTLLLVGDKIVTKWLKMKSTAKHSEYSARIMEFIILGNGPSSTASKLLSHSSHRLLPEVLFNEFPFPCRKKQSNWIQRKRPKNAVENSCSPKWNAPGTNSTLANKIALIKRPSLVQFQSNRFDDVAIFPPPIYSHSSRASLIQSQFSQKAGKLSHYR